MGSLRLRPVTINFLGVRICVKFRACAYDYRAKMSLEQATACYREALHRLTSGNVPYSLNVQVGEAVTSVGKHYSVSLFRYVKNGAREEVQCMLSLRFGETGSAELSVTYTTFGLMVEPDDYGEKPDAKVKEVTLWSD